MSRFLQLVADGAHKILQDYVKTAGKQMGIDLRIGSFARVQVGEGLERSDKDFAAEVAETLKSTA
jgi:elongation factor Ts